MITISEYEVNGLRADKNRLIEEVQRLKTEANDWHFALLDASQEWASERHLLEQALLNAINMQTSAICPNHALFEQRDDKRLSMIVCNCCKDKFESGQYCENCDEYCGLFVHVTWMSSYKKADNT